MATIFTKIINGELPCYKIYEDDKTFAFLDINPESEGHTLIVPKLECDKIYDLPEEYYTAMWATAKKLCAHYDQILGRRSIIKVVGTDVPHAHIHIMPYDEDWHVGRFLKLSDAKMSEIRDLLKLS